MWRPSSSRSCGQSSLNLMSRFCWVRIHDLKSTQARHGRFPCSKPCGAEAEAEAAASRCPAPRPRASVTKSSSVIWERAPPGRKEKRPLREKPAGSLGAAILPAYGRRGQERLRKVGQARAHAKASARRQEREPRPGAGLTLGREAEPGSGEGLGAEAEAPVGAEREAWKREEAGREAWKREEAGREAGAEAAQGSAARARLVLLGVVHGGARASSSPSPEVSWVVGGALRPR